MSLLHSDQVSQASHNLNDINAHLVDNETLLNYCLRALSAPGVTQLAIDLEGVSLSRNGKLSLIQVMTDLAQNTVWVVDVTVLGNFAFEYVGQSGWSLRTILENRDTVKMLFDVRNDSDSLYNLYGITLANVYDLQLLEIAVRRSNDLNAVIVSGLSSTITQYLNPDRDWKRVKDEGNTLFKASGNQELVEIRPLDPRIIQYAVQDVTLLFQLAGKLERALGDIGKNWVKRVFKASSKRVKQALKPLPQYSNPKKAKKAKIFAPMF
ncbi:ribonuclease H-like domain-containing protein [Crepidotus variabilis]|uniref:Ribonuclease H-like domain-containing protein n=1 Tax=Crepidotus variabilis TaxID=179855 RepID=A0A9P6EFZ6_9AGAR|nr:ribonuclease H-like domain-containing protein [Crepidotus variabilis]